MGDLHACVHDAVDFPSPRPRPPLFFGLSGGKLGVFPQAFHIGAIFLVHSWAHHVIMAFMETTGMRDA